MPLLSAKELTVATFSLSQAWVETITGCLEGKSGAFI